MSSKLPTFNSKQLTPALTDNLRRNRPGTAAYANGQATAEKILQVARQLIIDQGLNKVSMRRIARELAMSPGNLSYYYASKADLLEDLFSHVLNSYMSAFEQLRGIDAETPKLQLQRVLEYVFDDLSRVETTNFFPELWVSALRDSWAAEQMEHIYGLYRSVLADILRDLRPDLDEQTISDLALTLSATIEGHTVFVGYGRAHHSRASAVKKLIIGQLINLALTTQGDDQQP
jgi:AcrR family transcriptional regulator